MSNDSLKTMDDKTFKAVIETAINALREERYSRNGDRNVTSIPVVSPDGTPLTFLDVKGMTVDPRPERHKYQLRLELASESPAEVVKQLRPYETGQAEADRQAANIAITRQALMRLRALYSALCMADEYTSKAERHEALLSLAALEKVSQLLEGKSK